LRFEDENLPLQHKRAAQARPPLSDRDKKTKGRLQGRPIFHDSVLLLA